MTSVMDVPRPAEAQAFVRRSRTPDATYRLQLHREFTLADAAAAVPYLHALGISHVYLSPIFAAVPGSTHGYDVLDHSLVNPELGGLAGLYALDAALREHDMGLVIDIVPNHVGVSGLGGAQNSWWRDTLRFGSQSEYAAYFDIDWQGQPQLASGILVVPVLGAPFGAALESGELRLAYDEGEIIVRYHERSFPLNPATYSAAIGIPPAGLGAKLRDPDALAEFVGILENVRTAEPNGAMTEIARLRRLVGAEPALAAFLRERLEERSGYKGDARSFDQFESLLAQQHYRLAYWRVSGEEINYRRFFDINDLAAIRVEIPAVFDAVHDLVGQLAKEEIVTGVRVDHVDGLYAPGEYLRRLTTLLNQPDGRPRAACPIWVEKILNPGEQLESWPMAGTTGYDFIALVTGLLVDPAGARSLTKTLDDFVGDPQHYADIAYEARRSIAEYSFAGEVNVLSLQLHRLAQRHRRYRDITLNSLREGILALLASFPVYRTYDDGPDSAVLARGTVETALGVALHRDHDLSVEAMELLVSVLCLRQGVADETDLPLWAHFLRRFQQISAPVMAKGVEDTTFYRYPRLLALNEVGCHPDHFGTSFDAAHSWLKARSQTWPNTMSATTTHDTKRSEDARGRLCLLSELPGPWRAQVRAWARQNRRWLRDVDGTVAPGPQMEYYLYQTLVAAWEGRADPPFVERIKDHMTKAMREAKQATSWTRVNERHEAAVHAFVDDILHPRRSARFLARLDQFVADLAPAAQANSLALVTLKCMAPGFPDFYQGSEGAVYDLTDPDNRRPVDFAAASENLALRELRQPKTMHPEAKAWLTGRLLALRGEFHDLFASGSYVPVRVEGDGAKHIFAFMRDDVRRRALILVRLRSAARTDSDGTVQMEALGAAGLVDLPAGEWTNWLSGERGVESSAIDPALLLAEFPVAILISE